MKQKTIISLGGSLIVPSTGTIDAHYLSSFSQLVRNYLHTHQFFIIAGGGKTARNYIDAAELVVPELDNNDKDWLGIHATRLNAHLLRTIFNDIARPEIITDPTQKIDKEYVVNIGAGFRPGNSTDYIAAKLAVTNGIPKIINLSNITHAYNKDPAKYNDAKPLERATWTEFCKIVGDKWTPGLNAPFDPIASALAKENKLEVIIADGKNLFNLDNILQAKPYIGTTISAN